MTNVKPYTGGKLFALNMALGLGALIEILDFSIANVSIPQIAASLSVTPDQGTWVITSYSVSNAVVLPLAGWLSDYFGRVRLFVLSLVMFTIMSFLCGVSHTLPMLVTCRIFQGMVAGNLLPLSYALLMDHNPPQNRGMALGFWAMIVVVAPVTGPIVGGYITETFSWPWIFYINVPIGIFSAFLTWSCLKDRESPIIRKPVDWMGLVLLVTSVASIQIMLDKGRDLDWFNSNLVIALGVTGLVSFLYFIIWTLYEPYPVVDFSLFKDRNFLMGSVIMTIGYLFFFGTAVTLPLWLQTQQGYTSFWAGVAVAPIGVFPLLFSAVVGYYLYKVDARWLTVISFIIFSWTFFAQANFNTSVSLSYIMYVRLMQGMAVTLFFIPLVQVSLGNVPQQKYASASGVFNFMRILVGSGFGTSLAVQLWMDRAGLYHYRLSEAMSAYRPEVADVYSRFSQALPLESVHLLSDYAVQQQASVLSVNDLCWLAGWVYLLMIPLPFLCKRVVGTPVQI